MGERACDTDEHQRYAQNIHVLRVSCRLVATSGLEGGKFQCASVCRETNCMHPGSKRTGQAKLVYITHHTVNHTVGLNTLTVCLQASSVDLLVEFSTASSLIAHWLSCGWAVAPLGAG